MLAGKLMLLRAEKGIIYHSLERMYVGRGVYRIFPETTETVYRKSTHGIHDERLKGHSQL